MATESVLTFLVLLIGFYTAWNIGANDVSNAMGTSVGSKALTLKQAVIIAALLEFAGAFFLGGNVSQTMQTHLIDTQLFSQNPLMLILGMCGALLGTGIWLQIASYFGLPVSTTHAIVGAILGFGILSFGAEGVEWGHVGEIAISWIVSPVLSGFISFLLFSMLQKNILFALNPTLATRRLIPFLLFFVFGAFSLSLIFNGLGRLHLVLSLPHAIGISFFIGFIAFSVGMIIMKKIPAPNPSLSTSSRSSPQTLISVEKAMKHLTRTGADADQAKVAYLLKELAKLKSSLTEKIQFTERTSEYSFVEKCFGWMQIISACFVAFAHGANDVANSIAPVAVVIDTIKYGVQGVTSPVPSWLLAFGGFGIVIGLATWGWRVIATIGHKITELTPTRGFCAEFGAALTILLASKLGMPISTTHCLVGAVLGVGLARGISALNLRTLKEIVLSWIITLPASAIMSVLCYFLLRLIF